MSSLQKLNIDIRFPDLGTEEKVALWKHMVAINKLRRFYGDVKVAVNSHSMTKWL